MRTARAARAILVAALAGWTLTFIAAGTPEAIGSSFLHRVDLVFHEAGHVLFSPFGPFLTVLGGSIFQVLVPLVCAAALNRAADRFGAWIAVWWAGQNLFDLSPYIGDARALALPLLGGATGAEVEGHDWETILQTLGWLQYDRTLAAAARAGGLLVMVAALALAAFLLVRDGPQDGE